jgi:hypothetical protein
MEHFHFSTLISRQSIPHHEVLQAVSFECATLRANCVLAKSRERAEIEERPGIPTDGACEFLLVAVG